MREFADYLLPAKSASIPSMNPQSCGLISQLVNPLRAIDAWSYDMISMGYDRRWTGFWDTWVIDATKPASVQFQFFSKPFGQDGKTIQETNFTGSGSFPFPQAFVIHYPTLEIYPIPDANTDAEDQNLVLYNVYLKLVQNQKTYFECTGTDLPSGGGAFATYGPSSAAAQDVLVNGVPQSSARSQLYIPRIIETQQSFAWVGEMDPTAYAALIARHASAKITVRFKMWGEHFQKIG